MGINGSYVMWTLPLAGVNIKRRCAPMVRVKRGCKSELGAYTLNHVSPDSSCNSRNFGMD